MHELFRQIKPALLPICVIAILLMFSTAVFAQKELECKDKNKKSQKSSTSRKKLKNSNKISTKISTKQNPTLQTEQNRNRNRNETRVFATEFSRFAGAKSSNYKFGDSAERSINVSNKVNISICVAKGKIRINGWNRNEIRAFVEGSDQIGFSIIDKDKQSKIPVWLKVIGYDPAKNKGYKRSSCLEGDVIELDVPFGSTVNVKGGVGETIIDSVARVNIKNVGGNLFLSNIKDGVSAGNYEGNITVNKSGGAIALETTTGNIVAIETIPTDFGDSFKAKTGSGRVLLQSVEYRLIEINSITGSIKFDGELLNGGQYEFATSEGSITLEMEKITSTKVSAAYGGSFKSDLPIKELEKRGKGKIVYLTGIIGNGDANLNIKSFNGNIHLKKKN